MKWLGSHFLPVIRRLPGDPVDRKAITRYLPHATQIIVVFLVVQNYQQGRNVVFCLLN